MAVRHVAVIYCDCPGAPAQMAASMSLNPADKRNNADGIRALCTSLATEMLGRYVHVGKLESLQARTKRLFFVAVHRLEADEQEFGRRASRLLFAHREPDRKEVQAPIPIARIHSNRQG